MAEYIERGPVLLAVNMAMEQFPYAKDPKRPETYSKYNEGWTDACDYIIGMIEAENVADAEPVVHGRWIMDGKCHCHCSECKEGRNIRTKIGWNFCPNCGAKMDLPNGE